MAKATPTMKSGVVTMDRLTSSTDPNAGVRMNNARTIPIAAIEPNPEQPRKNFDSPEMQDYLQSLSKSMRKRGLLQPILVQRKIDGTYTLIAGESRLRAAKLLEWNEIPAIVREAGDEGVDARAIQLTFDALVENEQRKNLRPVDVARAIGRLVDGGVGVDLIVEETSMSPSSVSRYASIARYPDLVGRLEAGESLEKLYTNEVVPRNREAGETKGRKPSQSGQSISEDNKATITPYGTNDEEDNQPTYQAQSTPLTAQISRDPLNTPTPKEQHNQHRVTHPPAGTIPFRGQYISLAELAEMLIDINKGLLSSEARDIAKLTAPYDAKDAIEANIQLGMTLKGLFPSSES